MVFFRLKLNYTTKAGFFESSLCLSVKLSSSNGRLGVFSIAIIPKL